MIRKIVIFASILSLLSLPAMAQVVCSERGKFLERLASGYEETPIAMGLASNGSVLEVLASDGGLLNRYTVTSRIEGSNPSPSASTRRANILRAPSAPRKTSVSARVTLKSC